MFFVSADASSCRLMSDGANPDGDRSEESLDWSWNLKVWDVDNLKIGDYDEVTLGPTLVVGVPDRSGIVSEQRPKFLFSLAFEFVSGVRHA